MDGENIMSRNKRLLRYKNNEIRLASAELTRINNDLNDVYGRFNNTNDPALIDAYIYEMSALKSRYDYILKGIKLLF